ncbi:hypothetical protein ACFSKL_13090 [Belliella marina]|uniref:Lipoprotein n=1 Tax=Belliella marina TaxID=1644146 RepID=A0ABW4VM12_9BACT
MIGKYKKILHQVGKLKFQASTSLVIFLSAACMEQNNQICDESIPIGSDVTDLLVDNHKCNLAEQNEQDLATFKITSQSEFEELLTCQSPQIKIDFENEFIVGGQVKSYQCGSFKEAFSEKKCNKIKIGVNIQPQDCTGITDVLFFVSLPIEYINNDLEFEIVYLEP